MVLALAVVLGLRHALDPDHLVAVSTLVAGERERRARRTTLLGAAWGLGHATTLIVLGIPAVLLGLRLPQSVQHGAEVLIGLVIMALAARLVRRWRAGAFHSDEHAHGALAHHHPHRRDALHGHVHEHPALRSPLQSYGIGLLHGAAGSGAVVLLLVASIDDRARAAVALALFAGGTAVSMAGLSSGVGYALARGPLRRRFWRLAPVLGALSLAFGAWYAAAAFQYGLS